MHPQVNSLFTMVTLTYLYAQNINDLDNSESNAPPQATQLACISYHVLHHHNSKENKTKLGSVVERVRTLWQLLQSMNDTTPQVQHYL